MPLRGKRGLRTGVVWVGLESPGAAKIEPPFRDSEAP